MEKPSYLSPSSLLAWYLANREALLSGFQIIEPIHLYVSILKMLEGIFPLTQFEKRDHENGILEAKDLSNLGLEFLKVDIPQLTRLRRKLVQDLGQPNAKRDFERLSRSQVTHILFDRAIQKIRSEKKECATFIDLLMQIDRNSVETTLPEKKKAPVPIFPDVMLSTRKSVNPSQSNFITRFGRDLTVLAAQGKLNPMVGREKETNAITRILLRTTKRNVILIGEAGVGKTAVVEGLAQRLISLGAPPELQKTHIIQINIADLIANTIYRGEMEARVQELINEVSQNPNLVLFLDEIHLALKTGGGGQGALDIANILKPALARDDFRCIGATTNEEYDRYVKDDSAFNRRFQVITVNEPSLEETYKICESWAKKIGDHQKIQFDDEAIHEAISLCEKYIINRRFPDKAIDLMENSAVSVKINALHFSPDLSGHIKVTPDIIRETVRDHYGIDTLAKEMTHFESAKSFLEKSIIGQEQAVRQIDEALSLSYYRRFKDANGPLGALLFVGPDGVGKSFAARCIAKALFPNDTNAFNSFFMGDFKDGADLHLIIGSPPGYVESEHQGPLFRFAETHPQGVILLETFDRAHEDVQNFFLRILAAGEVNDNHGRTVSFRGHLFILTTNIPVQSPDPLSDLKLMMNHELLSMIDNIVVFKELDSLAYDGLFSKLLSDIKNAFPEKESLVLKIDETSRANILIFLSSSNPGIRGFQREFDKKISVPITKLIQKNAGISEIKISWENDKIQLTPG